MYKPMRDLRLLAVTYPEKTGKELLEIQEREKEHDRKVEEKKHEKLIRFVEKLNKGAYYRYKGSTQYGYDRVIKAYFMGDYKPYVDVESIVMFDKFIKDEFSVEKRIKTMLPLDTMGFNYDDGMTEEVTKREWDNLIKSLDNLKKHWQ